MSMKSSTAGRNESGTRVCAKDIYFHGLGLEGEGKGHKKDEPL